MKKMKKLTSIQIENIHGGCWEISIHIGDLNILTRHCKGQSTEGESYWEFLWW